MEKSITDVLSHLHSKKNVLLMGAPGTGKSRLMNEISFLFEHGVGNNPIPTHNPGASIPIPASTSANIPGFNDILARKNRKVFRTTLHQNSKYRDFITGITPRFDGKDGYTICEGILYRANEFAMQPDSAALLIIDELNRGPAIEVFGGSIATIEPDKRLGNDNTVLTTTQFFEILNPKTTKYEEYAFSPHLYILASINQADVSVAPLDVAFLRRWYCINLEPNYTVLYERFGLEKDSTLPEANPSSSDVYLAAIKALESINSKITIGRGAEYQIGQGCFLATSPKSSSLDDVLSFVSDVWSTIYAHIEELFFGDQNSIAYILNAGRPGSPFFLNEVSFAEETKFILSKKIITKDNLYPMLLSISGD